MKTDATTIAGMVAGAALSVAALPALPRSVTSVAGIVGAAAVGALGWHAKTCPAGCPGTDARGNPLTRPQSAVRKVIPVACFLILLATLAFVLLTGCAVTRATTTRTTDPTTGATVEKTCVTGATLFDSGQSLARASAHSGYATNGTWAPGVSMAGLSQTSSTSGLTVIVNTLAPVAKAAAVP